MTASGGSPDWIIDEVTVWEFEYEAIDIGVDTGGFNPVYEPGGRLRLTGYAITIATRGGARGEYVPMWGGTPMALAQTLALAPHLVGRSAHDRAGIYDDLKRAHRQYDHMGYGAIDICLWDLAGKALGSSVSVLLGSAGRPVPTYASTLHGDRNGGLDSPQAYADFAEQCLALGYPAFKAHGWCDGDVTEETGLVTALADRVGDRMTLMLDPACELRTLPDAVAVGQACDRAGFAWYEDPFRDGGVSTYAHRQLRQRLNTPLLMTEHVRGVEPKADWLAAEATDLLRADPEYDLGITGAMKIAALAEAFGVNVEIHACGPAHRHLVSALRNTSYYELALVHPRCANPLPDVYASDYHDDLDSISSDGTVDIPDGPGLGVAYDWDRLRRLATTTHRFA